MRLINTLILCVCFSGAMAQANITGPAVVEPGSTVYYEAYFNQQPHSASFITWNGTGGTVPDPSANPTLQPNYIIIQWDNSTTIGTIYINEDIGGQSGGLDVQVGVPLITPQYQFFNYGTAPGYLQVNMAQSITNATFQWQVSVDGINWANIS